jgi:hypothetical protein
VIGRKLKKSLENLPEFDRGMGAADLIGRILSHFVPLMEKEHQRCEQQYSRYRFVSPDPKEKRDHINVDLPEKAYRFLKVMHQDMNFYSIGQIIRRYLVRHEALNIQTGENPVRLICHSAGSGKDNHAGDRHG